MKICHVGTELFCYSDRQTHSHGEANTRFSQFFERASQRLWYRLPAIHYVCRHFSF